MGVDIAIKGGIIFYIIYIVPILFFTYKFIIEPKTDSKINLHLIGVYILAIFNTIQFIKCFLPY